MACIVFQYYETFFNCIEENITYLRGKAPIKFFLKINIQGQYQYESIKELQFQAIDNN